MTTKMMDLAEITADVRCQSRTELDDALVAEYAEQIAAGTTFPPLMAIQGDEGTYLYDGFHRYYALKRAGRTSAKVDISPGTLRDAVLNSAGANATHGKRRSNADKRRSVETLLNDQEWSGWSNSEIARRCAVSEALVRSARPIFEKNEDRPRLTQRNGTTYEMSTTNIGKRESTAFQGSERLSDLDYEIVDPITGDTIEGRESGNGASVPLVSSPPRASTPSAFNSFEQQTAEMLKNTDPQILKGVSEAHAKVEEPHVFVDAVYASIQLITRAQHELRSLPSEARVREALFGDDVVQRDLGIGLDTIGAVAAKLRSLRAQTDSPNLRRVS